jgi:hypothetical protein
MHVIKEGLMLSTLAYIIYTPEDQVRKSVKEANERIKASGTPFHWPPETEDENLVSLYKALQGPDALKE